MFKRYLLLSLEEQWKILIEIIRGRRGQSAYYITLSKKLILDIGNQLKKLIITISVDTTNYFNRMAYPFVALTCRHFSL